MLVDFSNQQMPCFDISYKTHLTLAAASPEKILGGTYHWQILSGFRRHSRNGGMSCKQTNQASTDSVKQLGRLTHYAFDAVLSELAESNILGLSLTPANSLRFPCWRQTVNRPYVCPSPTPHFLQTLRVRLLFSLNTRLFCRSNVMQKFKANDTPNMGTLAPGSTRTRSLKVKSSRNGSTTIWA